MTAGYEPRTCVCGHPSGEHKSSGSAGLTVRYGYCFREDCDCRSFDEALIDDPLADVLLAVAESAA